MPLPSVVKGVRACRLPAVSPLPSVVKGVQACRLPALKLLKPLKPLKCSVAASTRHRGSFDQALMPLPSVVKGVRACRLPAVSPLPSVVKGVQACRLPALKLLKPLKPLKPLKCSAAASTRHSCHCPLLLRAFKFAVCQPSGRQATALCCSGRFCKLTGKIHTAPRSCGS